MPRGLTPRQREPLLAKKREARKVTGIPLPDLSFTGGAAGPAISGGGVTANQGGTITVNPVGINLGEIAQNFSGPPANGGFGLDLWSRLFPRNSRSSPSGGVAAASLSDSNSGLDLTTVALVLAGGAALFFLLRK